MPRPGFEEVVLLTGLPSSYGRRLAIEILAEEPKTFLYAPIAARDAARAASFVGALPGDQRERVALLDGGACAMDLGLSGAELRALGREVDVIHHAHHLADLGADKKRTRHENLISAAEIIEVARSMTELTRLVFHSTAHVSGDRTGVVYEDELERGQSFRSDVEEMRMRAEVLARRGMQRLPITVLRPSMVVTDALDDDDLLDGLHLLVLFVLAAPADLAIPLPSRGDVPLHLVPMSFVAKAARILARHPAALGRTFHLVDPNPLSARATLDLVARAAADRSDKSVVPSRIAKAVLRAPGIERFVKSPRSFVEQLATRVRYDARLADQLLAPLGVTCPPFDQYVASLVRIVQDHIRARREERFVAGAGPEPEADDPLL